MLSGAIAAALFAASSVASAQQIDESAPQRTARIAFNTFMSSCIAGVVTGQPQVEKALSTGMRRLEQRPPGLPEADPTAVVLQVRAPVGYVYLHLSPTDPTRCSVSVFGVTSDVLKNDFTAGLNDPESPYELKRSRPVADGAATLDTWISRDARLPVGITVIHNPNAQQTGVAALYVTLSENN